MRNRMLFIILCIGLLSAIGTGCFAAEKCVGRYCEPERPICPESVGDVTIPFDMPIWPTLLKTEFNVLPWVSLGKASVCFPGSCSSWEIPCPKFSLKPLPMWIPWLRPLDVEVEDDCR